MQVVAMGVLVLTMLGLQFWVRTYYYSRSFHPRPRPDRDAIYAPVNGRVVYVRRAQGSNVYSDKGDRQVRTPLELEGEYTQVGVFVGPYDNHHVLAPTPIDGTPLRRADVMDAVNLVMVTFADRWHGFSDWWERHIEGFLSHNQRIVLSWTPEGWPQPCYMVVIMDRFLNRFYEAPAQAGRYESGDVVGFIGRGSQVDLFIPGSVLAEPIPEALVGTRVTADSTLGRFTRVEASANA